MTKSFLEELLRSYTVPALMVLLVILTLSLVYYRYRYVYLTKKKKVYLPEISDFLTNMTFMGLEEKELNQEVLKFKADFPYHKKWFRRLVLSSLLDLSQNLKGDLVDHVKDIYVAFGLHKYSIGLINSWFWRVKCTGIYHLQSLNFTEGQKYVEPYVNSPYLILRSNAFIANLYLTKEPFDFLVSYPFPISSVNEYKVIDVFFMKKEPLPGNIDKWLDSENESIIALGLKVMVFHNYAAEQDKIISLLDHPNSRIRLEAVHAVKELFLVEAEEKLHEMFFNEEENLKFEILQTLKVIGSESTVEFIKRHLKLSRITPDIKMGFLTTLKGVDSDIYQKSFKKNLEIGKMKLHLDSPYI